MVWLSYSIDCLRLYSFIKSLPVIWSSVIWVYRTTERTLLSCTLLLQFPMLYHHCLSLNDMIQCYKFLYLLVYLYILSLLCDAPLSFTFFWHISTNVTISLAISFHISIFYTCNDAYIWQLNVQWTVPHSLSTWSCVSCVSFLWCDDKIQIKGLTRPLHIFASYFDTQRPHF